MRTTVIAAFVLSAFTGCIKSTETSELAIADHEAVTIEDCFSTLLAGPRDQSGKLERVSFAHGICQGNSKALDKLSSHANVIIIKDGTSYVSSLHMQGQDVTARLDGLTVKIGRLDSDADSSELLLVNNARLELAVDSANNIQVWSPSNSVQGRESIRIHIN